MVGSPVKPVKVIAPTKRSALSVITTLTWAPRRPSSRTSSTALNAAMPPLTPTNTFLSFTPMRCASLFANEHALARDPTVAARAADVAGQVDGAALGLRHLQVFVGHVLGMGI